MATLLTGKPVVDRLAQELAPRIEALGRAGIAPTLAIVRMGERPDDLSLDNQLQQAIQLITQLVDLLQQFEGLAMHGVYGGKHLLVRNRNRQCRDIRNPNLRDARS